VFSRRQSGLPASAYVAQFSTTLDAGSWTPLGPSGAVPHPELDGFEQVTVPLPETHDGKGFIRLHVIGP
jgi:hypothetical protein